MLNSKNRFLKSVSMPMPMQEEDSTGFSTRKAAAACFRRLKDSTAYYLLPITYNKIAIDIKMNVLHGSSRIGFC